MKITKELEAEIRAMMDDYWGSYFRGDLEQWQSYLVDDYRNIGGTEEEIWNSKQEIVEYTHRVIDQMAGLTELRNMQTQIIPYDGYLMVHEFMDIFIRIEEKWTFYGKFRLSSLIQKIADTWKVLHQHGSYPDSHTEQGEAFAFDTLRKENTQLREAVKRRTVELENKNHELKIEAAVERVRARAMAMHNSNELNEVVSVLFEKLKDLQIPFTAVGIATGIEGSKDLNAFVCGQNEAGLVIINYRLPYFDNPIPKDLYNALEKQLDPFVSHYSKEEKDSFYEYVIEHTAEFRHLPEDIKQMIFESPTYTITHVAVKNANFNVNDFEGKVLAENEIDIIKRFARVFDQAYTRFLDLQKAEAQAKEAQIEAALEKVRSRSLAMTKSDQLSEVILEIHKKFKELEVSMESRIAIVVVLDSVSKDFNQYIASQDVGNTYISTPYFQHPILDDFYEAKEAGIQFFSKAYSEEEKNSYFKRFFETSFTSPEIAGDVKEEQAKWVFAQKFYTHSQAFQKNSCIGMADYSGVPLTEYEIDIIKRFSKVFDQAYTRFLDLKKSEEQAREAQIEAALEKVRSRSLAMHKSDELKEVVSVLFEKLKGLQIPFTAVGIATGIEGSKDLNVFVCGENEAGLVISNYRLPYFDNPISNDLYSALEKQLDFFVGHYSKEEKNSFYEYVIENTAEFKHLPEDIKQMIFESPTYTISTVAVKNAVFNINDFEGKVLADYEIDIIKRFARVFDQAYTRFLDLQKAEAQAREAQIETALEKVRSSSLAMHKSDELNNVVRVLFEKMTELQVPSTAVAIQTFTEGSKDMQVFVCGDVGTGLVINQYLLPYFDHPIIHDYLDAHKKKLDSFVGSYSKKEKDSFYDVVLKLPELSDLPAEVKTMIRQSNLYEVTMVPAEKSLMAVNDFRGNPLSESQVNILKRFTKVFDQAYIRFLDIQKAETQARKAQIEASLERVRAKAMSMQNSDELDEVLSVLCEQFDVLGILPMSTHMTVFNFSNNTFTFRETGKYGDRSFGEQTVDLDAMDTWKDTVDKWKADKATAVNKLHFPKETLPEVWEVFHESFASMPEESRITPDDYPNGIYHTAGKHPFGYIGMNQVRPATGEEEEIVIKFANEFGRAYQRFLDLQKAEEQAREAKIETALEKIRSQTMAMQKGEELKEVAVLLYKELIALGVTNFVTCGYVEIDENINRQYTWVTAPGGDTLGLFYLPLTGDATFDERYAAWKRQQVIFHQTVAGEVRSNHLEYAITTFNSKEAEEMVRSQFPDPTVFYCFNFSHGYLHIVTGSELKEEEELLLARFTKVFEQAYTRFLDLQKAEEQAGLIREERDRLEIALNELHATQSQLVQQEKLASLGQLTAGIAHEIKNPLNFVNNFSDVSIELVEEAREEIRRETGDGGPGNSKSEQNNSPLKKGDKGGCSSTNKQGSSDENKNSDLILEILDDIEANLKTIHKHGSRADSIVKSMLQHSRGGDGKMEPTPLNPIIKEYVNLAFHGMRAGKEPINVGIDLQLDDKIGEIPIVAEDFSRVILNLCNNGFDAMREKEKLTGDGGPRTGKKSLRQPAEGAGVPDGTEVGDDTELGYHPKLTVRTDQTGKSITIEIEDNGPGIPDEIRDKIMQPFFTTKKGTQGTGLGLSITNDIVKAHGGELTVTSQTGAGTTFMIKLPIF